MNHKRLRYTLLWRSIWTIVFLLFVIPLGVFAQKEGLQNNRKLTLASSDASLSFYQDLRPMPVPG